MPSAPRLAEGRVDAVVVGGGHNGLVAAARLARAGRSVRVLEKAEIVGGAARTERPFPKAPGVRQSTGAYLLGLMSPEILAGLEVTLPLLRRDPHYFLPTRGDRYLLFGADREAFRAQMQAAFSERDLAADDALAAEVVAFRDDVAPAWLEEPRSIEETAERYVRPALRKAFVDLCRGSIGRYLDRFGFESEILPAMYAVTDGFTGCHGGWDTPGTGMNFLVHNMCRLPGAGGTWMIVEGGMGTVTARIADAARRAGATIDTNAEVAAIEVAGGRATGVALADGSVVHAERVLVATDPFRMLALAGEAFPESYRARIRRLESDGTTMKVNLCLDGLPRFTCLPEDRGQHRATMHILPEAPGIVSALRREYAEVCAGRLASRPTIEWYVHTTVDPSLSETPGLHSSALFVQWVPYAPVEGSWDDLEAGYVRKLLAICDEFAPGISERVVDTFTLTPPKVEARFGMHRGHIHHVDNRFGFDDRVPYRTPVDGLFACGAGCHPAGSVIGAAGWNAAGVALES